jgi:hypothetical protein
MQVMVNHTIEMNFILYKSENNMTQREEIEQQAKSYTLAVFDELDDFSDITQAYIDGAEWMQETMIEKACKWLLNIDFDGQEFRDCDESFNNDLLVDAFRKAMED